MRWSVMCSFISQHACHCIVNQSACGLWFVVLSIAAAMVLRTMPTCPVSLLLFVLTALFDFMPYS